MIIFMGVAGSGKSVQGKMLADELGLPWLSTGEFLRMLIAGERRKEMLQGKLLDDAEIITLLQKIFTIIDTGKEFILDGFPRTARQADWLLNQVKHDQLKITAVIHLTASEEVMRKRLLERARPDDHPEAISERFKEYEQAVLPMIEQFQSANVTVHEVDGDQTISEIHESIKKILT